VGQRSVDELVTYAKRDNKPILLYFPASYGPYSRSQKHLDDLLCDPRIAKIVGETFVFELYQRYRNEGGQAATRFGINTIQPVLVVLTPAGEPHLKWVVPWNWNAEGHAASAVGQTPEFPRGVNQFAYDLQLWGQEALTLTDKVIEEARLKPKDTVRVIAAAQRAWASSDTEQARHWLGKVAESDDSARNGLAARADWESSLLELSSCMTCKGLNIARNYVARHPAYGLPGARLLAAMGAERAEVEAALFAVLDNSTPVFSDADSPATVHIDINGFVFDALELGANDSALAAARAQVQAAPEDANAFDTLAQVHAARGEYEEAVHAARNGLMHTDDLSTLADVLRTTIRFAEAGSAVDRVWLCRRSLLESMLKFPGENVLFFNAGPAADRKE
jgi:hypothetical protein